MFIPHPHRALSLAGLLVGILLGARALAAPNGLVPEPLQDRFDQAMAPLKAGASQVAEQRFLAVDRACGSACDGRQHAQLWTYVGVCRSRAGMSDAARQAFAQALLLSPEAKPDAALLTDKVRADWKAAQDQAARKPPRGDSAPALSNAPAQAPHPPPTAASRPGPRDAAANRKRADALALLSRGEPVPAEALLLGIERACGDQCSVELRAALWAEIGIARFQRGSEPGAREAFLRALQLSPSVLPDPTYTSARARALFDKTRASVPPAAAPLPVAAGAAPTVTPGVGRTSPAVVSSATPQAGTVSGGAPASPSQAPPGGPSVTPPPNLAGAPPGSIAAAPAPAAQSAPPGPQASPTEVHFTAKNPKFRYSVTAPGGASCETPCSMSIPAGNQPMRVRSVGSKDADYTKPVAIEPGASYRVRHARRGLMIGAGVLTLVGLLLGGADTADATPSAGGSLTAVVIAGTGLGLMFAAGRNKMEPMSGRQAAERPRTANYASLPPGGHVFSVSGAF